MQRNNNIEKFHLVPNVTNISMTIEERAELMAKNLKSISQKHGWQKLHVIAHSFTGVDARAAISLYEASKHVQSLTTICSPHLGMRLIDNCNKNPSKHPIEKVDKIFEAVGLSQKNSYEFSTENIENFNLVALDSPEVDYYSMGA